MDLRKSLIVCADTPQDKAAWLDRLSTASEEYKIENEQVEAEMIKNAAAKAWSNTFFVYIFFYVRVCVYMLCVYCEEYKFEKEQVEAEMIKPAAACHIHILALCECMPMCMRMWLSSNVYL